MCFIGFAVVSACILSTFVIILHQILGILFCHLELLCVFFGSLLAFPKEVPDYLSHLNSHLL